MSELKTTNHNDATENENNEKHSWYKDIKFNQTDNIHSKNTFDWTAEKIFKVFCQKIIETGGCVNSKLFEGYFDPKNKQKISDFFKTDRKIIFAKYNSEYSESSEVCLCLGKEDAVSLFFEGDDNISVEVYSSSQEFMDTIQNFMSELLTKRSNDNLGKAHVLSTSFDGISTREIGVVGVPLVLENYTDEIKEGIQEILSDLRSPLPNGKLIILEGDPGSGKTFLVRSLISEISNAFFVIVPPAMVSQLGDPQMIPVLLRLKSDEEDIMSDGALDRSKTDKVSKPIVLIVEDADQCLVRREEGNMATISTVLNLTSGILGDMLDIRIIATTNAKKKEMDEAILRDGRMSYHLEVGKLKFSEACDIYKRLMEDPDAQFVDPNDVNNTTNDVLLATVYKEAKRCGFRGEAKGEAKSRTNSSKERASKFKKRMGF